MSTTNPSSRSTRSSARTTGPTAAEPPPIPPQNAMDPALDSGPSPATSQPQISLHTASGARNSSDPAVSDTVGSAIPENTTSFAQASSVTGDRSSNVRPSAQSETDRLLLQLVTSVSDMRQDFTESISRVHHRVNQLSKRIDTVQRGPNSTSSDSRSDSESSRSPSPRALGPVSSHIPGTFHSAAPAQ